jgi:hypothetical protein
MLMLQMSGSHGRARGRSVKLAEGSGRREAHRRRPIAWSGLRLTEHRAAEKGSAGGAQAAGTRRRLRRERGGSLGVRIARQRMPRLPRVVAVRPHRGAGGLLEGEEGSGAGQWGHASAREGAQSAAERPTVSGRAAGPAREKKQRRREEGGRRC